MNARSLVSQIGPLRLSLFVLALLTVLLRPPAGGEAVYHGWGLVTTLLVPALTPLVFMGLMFDALMARVVMIDKQGAQRQRYRLVAWLSFAVGVAVAAFWMPFFMSLWSQ